MLSSLMQRYFIRPNVRSSAWQTDSQLRCPHKRNVLGHKMRGTVALSSNPSVLVQNGWCIICHFLWWHFINESMMPHFKTVHRSWYRY